MIRPLGVRTLYKYIYNIGEIIEVKGDNKMDDEVVEAKKLYATEMAMASNMKYDIIKSSGIKDGRYRLDHAWMQ